MSTAPPDYPKDWVTHLPDGTTIEGLEKILNIRAIQGWELVSAVGFSPTNQGVVITFIYKRPHI